MTIEERLLGRLEELEKEGAALARTGGGKFDQVSDPSLQSACKSWLIAVQHAVHLACASSKSPYRAAIDHEAETPAGWKIHHHVNTAHQTLIRLINDARSGLLTSVANQARAEVFDDFLDGAREYRRLGRKNESGAIAGVVFEDSMRRLCDMHSLPQKGVELDQLISALAKADVLTAAKAKRARAAAHLRTKATHAQWDEFDLGDVDATIEFAAEVIRLLE